MDWEKKIMDSKDEKLIEIIKNYARQNKIVSQSLIVTIIIGKFISKVIL